MEYLSHLKAQAEKAQGDLFQAVLVFFALNSNKSFTNRDIKEKLGIVSGGYHDNFIHGLLGELEKMDYLEKCPPGEGFKYKQPT